MTDHSREDDFAVIEKVLNGDTQCYAEIVRAHGTKVLGLCTSLLGNAAQADDAAQEIFIKAYQSLRSFRKDASFSTWLYRIASNHCKDLLRKRTREKTQSLDALIEAHGENRPAYLEPAVDAAASRDARHVIESLLSGLSEDERVILTLREMQGLSYEEIARVQGCSLDAVKARLKRARAALLEKSRHFLDRTNV